MRCQHERLSSISPTGLSVLPLLYSFSFTLNKHTGQLTSLPVFYPSLLGKLLYKDEMKWRAGYRAMDERVDGGRDP